MSKSDLKAAMQSLQVNRPLKLFSRAPSFVPPMTTSPNPTPVENPTQVKKPTEVELHTQVLKVTQVESATPVIEATEVLKETPAAKQTPVENQTKVMNETPVSKPTEVEKGVETTRRAIEQDSSVVLEARASEGLEKGYTRVPNTILMKMANGDLTRGEIKILLLIARFTISFQRKLAPLSKTVLERQSGLRGSAVLEALSGLVAKKLIIKEQGDQHRPNMLGLVLPADWDQLIGPETSGAKSTSVQKPTQVKNPTEVAKAAPVAIQTPEEVQKPTSAPVGNPSPFKDIKIYSNKNSHSQLPELLQKYFDELKPAKKRESELKAFQELCLDYSSQDIVDCFSVIRDRGIGSGAEPCHSPMAFLSKAMDSVFAEVEERRKKSRDRAEREQRESNAKIAKAELEARETAEWEKKEKAFLTAFPDENRRQEILAEMCRDLPFKLAGEAARVMGIGKWHESNQ